MFDKLGRVASMDMASYLTYVRDWANDSAFRAARDYARENDLDNEGFSDVLASYSTAHDLLSVTYFTTCVAVLAIPIIGAVKLVKWAVKRR